MNVSLSLAYCAVLPAYSKAGFACVSVENIQQQEKHCLSSWLIISCANPSVKNELRWLICPFAEIYLEVGREKLWSEGRWCMACKWPAFVTERCELHASAQMPASIENEVACGSHSVYVGVDSLLVGKCQAWELVRWRETKQILNANQNHCQVFLSNRIKIIYLPSLV